MKLEQFVTNVNKKLKKNIIVKGNEVLECPRFDTGSLSLNVELGGGAPEGRIITLAGLDGDGKSAMSLKMTAGFQKKHPNKRVLWLDAEGSWDDAWARHLGVKETEVALVRPEYAEQGYQIAVEALEADDLGLIVIDSVAAMLPKAIAEGDMEDSHVAVAARLHKRFLSKAQKFLIDCKRDTIPTIILINQMTTNIGGYGNPEIEGGGKGLRYYPSVKIILKKGELFDGKKTYKYIGQDQEGVEVKAQAIKFYVEKNKTAPPKRRGHFWFYFDHLDAIRTKGSIDRLEEIIRYSLKYEIVKQRTSAYDIPNPATGELMTFKGSAALAEYIRENEAVQTWIEQETLKRVNAAHEEEPVSVDEEEKKSEGHTNGKADVFGEFTIFADDEDARDEGSEETGSEVAAELGSNPLG